MFHKSEPLYVDENFNCGFAELKTSPERTPSVWTFSIVANERKCIISRTKSMKRNMDLDSDGCNKNKALEIECDRTKLSEVNTGNG